MAKEEHENVVSVRDSDSMIREAAAWALTQMGKAAPAMIGLPLSRCCKSWKGTLVSAGLLALPFVTLQVSPTNLPQMKRLD
jgi:hypothetical protein